MRLRVLVGAVGGAHLAGAVIDVVMALCRTVDAVGPIQAGVEPLRRVRRPHLARQHDPDLVIEGAGVGFAIEIAALPAPIGPGPGEPVEALLRAGLAAAALGFGQRSERFRVGLAAPQKGRHPILLDREKTRRHAGLAQVFLGQDVAGDLAPLGRHLDPLGREDDGAVRVADLARGRAEADRFVGVPTFLGEAARDLHYALSR